MKKPLRPSVVNIHILPHFSVKIKGPRKEISFLRHLS